MLVYAVARMIQVIQGDVSLAMLQSSLLEKSVQRKAAATFEKDLESRPAAEIAGGSRFGLPMH
jgi:hypothetical protein